MPFCNLTHLEAHVTPLQHGDSNKDEQGLLTLSGNDARRDGLSNKGLVCHSTPGIHNTSEEILRIKQ